MHSLRGSAERRRSESSHRIRQSESSHRILPESHRSRAFPRRARTCSKFSVIVILIDRATLAARSPYGFQNIRSFQNPTYVLDTLHTCVIELSSLVYCKG